MEWRIVRWLGMRVRWRCRHRRRRMGGPGGTDPNAGKGPLGRVAWYRDASVDGSRVFFTSRVELTNDADTGPEDNAANLYECEMVEEQKCKLSDLTVLILDRRWRRCWVW